jgi:phospholipid transport system substrate-binding protein
VLLLATCGMVAAFAGVSGVRAQAAEPMGDAQLEAARAVVVALQNALIDAAALEGVDARYAFLLPHIRATHDLAEIARLTIRRDFERFSPDEQADFVEAFERLSVMNYAARFTGLTEHSFRIGEIHASSADRVDVGTFIRNRQDEEIPIDYVLQHSSDGWRIINIVADGVSDIALKRAEYRAILQTGTAADLISAIDGQAEALRAG